MGAYGYSRRAARAAGPRANRYAAACETCGGLVPALAGILTGGPTSGYVVRHLAAVWAGSPVSGRWSGGCPAGDKLAASRAAARASTPAGRHDSSKYAYTASGTRTTMSSRRCEDAPCCGCCD
jgi:hypothetical protein